MQPIAPRSAFRSLVDGAASAADEQTIVGRVRERAVIESCIEAAARGEGQVVILEGEAGIGKSRLLAAAAATAAARGMRIAWGRAWDRNTSPPYWPWLEVLRALDGEGEAPGVAATLGVFAGLARNADDVAPAIDPRERILLFDSVLRRLDASARDRPLLILLDDLHAADDDSLLLADFVLCRIGAARICVVAASRPLEAHRSASAWVRSGSRLTLGGLAANEVVELLTSHVARQAGSDRYVVPEAGVVARLIELTAGNPFFLQETFSWLHCSSSAGRVDVRLPAALHVPARLQGAIELRLAGLHQATRSLLRVAAVVGRVIPLELLAYLWRRRDRSPPMTELLVDARSGGMLEPADGSSVALQFTHDLIREHLYAECPAGPRAGIHAEIAAWTARHPEVFPSGATAAVASHLQRAGAHATPRRVADATAAAARSAFERFAFSECIRHWEDVLRQLSAHDPRGKSRWRAALRAEALVGTGRALNHLSRRSDARAVLQEVIEIARRRDDARLLADAVLAFGGELLGTMEVANLDAGPGAVFADSLAQLLREALERAGSAATVQQARLMSRLAVEQYFTSPQEERERLARQAEGIARESGDVLVLGELLCEGVVATWSPDNGPRRVALAREAISLGQVGARPSLEAAARVLTVNALIELGDADAVAAEAAAMLRLEERAPLPLFQWQVAVYRGMRALAAGDIDAAEAHFASGLQLDSGQHAWLTYAVQMLELRVLQGRAGEMRDTVGLIKAIADRYPAMGYLQTMVAYLYLHVGDAETAAAYFDRAEAGGFAGFRRDITFVTALVRAGEVAVALRREAAVAALFEQLLPYASQFSLATYGGCTLGAVERTLGSLAAAAGRGAKAELHLRRAIAANAAMGCWLWVVHAQLDLADVLLRRLAADSRASDAVLAEVESLSDAVTRRIERIDLPPLRDRCAALSRRLDGHKSATAAAGEPVHCEGSAPAAGPVVETCRFHFDGDQWHVAFGSRLLHVRPSRGMDHLAVLVARPGQEIHCVELVRMLGEGTGAGSAEMLCAESHAGAMIDPQAKAEYRRRVLELRSLLADAEEAGRCDDAERFRDEIEAIAEQLRGALGLGGRLRQAGSQVERCRLNVTRTIHAAVDRIARLDAAFGTHLRQSIRTGTFCSYLGEQLRRRPAVGRRG